MAIRSRLSTFLGLSSFTNLKAALKSSGLKLIVAGITG
jgi:hypothetical protein